MKSVPNLSLAQIYPPVIGSINFNACHDPDCGNFGVAADLTIQRFKGPNAHAREMALRSNSGMAGLGRYKLNSNVGSDYRRTSTAFEYQGDPHQWMDRKLVQCQFEHNAGPCGVTFELISNEHVAEEIERLRDYNGVLEGPSCKACGQRYLEAPEQFVLNGAHGHLQVPGDEEAPRRPARVRLIHKPCKGQPGARFSVTLDHVRQRRTAENVQILQALVNGAGLNQLMRILAPSGSGRACGASRLYDRIFWLERTLLAFEREQLRRWRERVEASDKIPHHHLAHDDIVLGVNWETSEDRRITQLNCSATADIRSGYVFRLDADFDPSVDPATFFENAYLNAQGDPTSLRKLYTRASGLQFTAPLMSFQRPTGRFDEHHFFAAAASQLEVFRETQWPRMPEATPARQLEKQNLAQDLDEKIALIRTLHHGYFNLPDSTRDRRAPFTGIMTRDLMTKAAHWHLVREALPAGRFLIVTEQEGMRPGLLPHIFREEIEADDFTWLALTFDKDVKKPTMLARVEAFRRQFEGFVDGLRKQDPIAEQTMTNAARMRAFIAKHMTTYVVYNRFGDALPFQSSNYQQSHTPQIWIRCPVQSHGETQKVVGFPLVRRTLRQRIKGLPFDHEIADQDTRERVARLVWSATIQPVSSFFNALRERISFARRAGGRASRSGSSYINGAVYSPRVLIAVLNIFRVYYNFLEARPYVAPWSSKAETDEVAPGYVKKRVPGSARTVMVEKRRTRRPVHRNRPIGAACSARQRTGKTRA